MHTTVLAKSAACVCVSLAVEVCSNGWPDKCVHATWHDGMMDIVGLCVVFFWQTLSAWSCGGFLKLSAVVDNNTVQYHPKQKNTKYMHLTCPLSLS